METISKIFGLTLAVFLLYGCYSTSTIRQVGKAPVYQVEVSNLDDPLEPTVDVITGMEAGDVVRVMLDDLAFARIHSSIDKQTGEPAFIRVITLTSSKDWMYWKSARYLEAGQLVEFEVLKVDTDVRCSAGSCDHYETDAFLIDEGLLRSRQSDGTSFDFRLVSSKFTDGQVDLSIGFDHLSAFLARYDETIAALNSDAGSN